MKKFRIAILVGGPSPERGVSLNSGRSVLDNLESKEIDVIPIYFDYKKNPFLISKAQLYSNTPSDFDFKLNQNAQKLNLNNGSLLKLLRSVDLVFPIIHGLFGEDGQIQAYLENNNIPFVGSKSKACKLAFDKFFANQFIKSLGFFGLPSIAIEKNTTNSDGLIRNFFDKNKIKKAIVKPAIGGSSIGVFSVGNASEAIKKKNILLGSKFYKRVVVEPFCEGKEFTVIIIQSHNGEPVAILPTEIETSYVGREIFDYRKKYLPTNQVKYHYPPRFSDETINTIRKNAEEIFSAFGIFDFARFDGWVMPDGQIWFSDFNPISGMEQNSFLFQQSTRIGMGHKSFLRYVVKNACLRYEIAFVDKDDAKRRNKRKPVSVLFGGKTAECQVSLMSGTNVWLKLRKSSKYLPKPYLLDAKNNVWELPYALAINHTVEDVLEQCKNASSSFKRLESLVKEVKNRLLPDDVVEDKNFIPKSTSLNDFLRNSKYVFVGLHGGAGEDGTIQNILDKNHIKYNGSRATTSKICMNKWETGRFISKLKLPGIVSIPQKIIKVKSIHNFDKVWKNLVLVIGSRKMIVKPVSDGCSSGIVKLNSVQDLKLYIKILKSGQYIIPKNFFEQQNNVVEMPITKTSELLFEKYIVTDVIYVRNNKLIVKPKTGWIEITIGILEKQGKYHALNPSLTIAENEVLSLEEKFQSGTGINITPPPVAIVGRKNIIKAKKLIEQVSRCLNIKGYARVDAFLETKTGNLIIIEVNTLPGLTPSTVIYHQALAEKKPMYPTYFLETIIQNSGY